MNQTPLNQRHRDLGARLVPFAGWEMPVQYSGILEEARTVRRAVGLFDLCHMGRFRVEGPDSEALLQGLVTNDVSKIKPGAIRYALLTNEDGGVLDDVLVYRDPDTPEQFFVVVNASNCARDLEWMRSHIDGRDCVIHDRTRELAMIALQGPASEATLDPVTSTDLSSVGYYTWLHTEVDGVRCSVSRTGYTGEDGFEIYYPISEAERIWDAILVAGAKHDIAPIGLAARDTLRLEAAMALYGHELGEDINPYEARLGWAVKLKTEFIGRDALAKVKEVGPSRLLVGLVTQSRRVPRQGYVVTRDGKAIGHIASGTASPTLGKNIATAFVAAEHAVTGTELCFRVRDRDLPAIVADLPFYKRDS